jgi:hypothetical protein
VGRWGGYGARWEAGRRDPVAVGCGGLPGGRAKAAAAELSGAVARGGEDQAGLRG